MWELKDYMRMLFTLPLSPRSIVGVDQADVKTSIVACSNFLSPADAKYSV